MTGVDNHVEEPPFQYGGARFHFDPFHDQENVPTLAQVEAWLRGRLTADGPHEGLPAVYRDVLKQETSSGWRTRLANLLPGVARGTRRRVEEQCVAAAMVQMERLHRVMREYAVDLTSHPRTDIVESLAALAIRGWNLHRLMKLAESGLGPAHPDIRRMRRVEDALEQEARIEGFHGHIRNAMADEAVANLMKEMVENPDPRRHFAALLAARDEVEGDTRGRIDEIVAAMQGRSR